MRQQSMFAKHQAKCEYCGLRYVPLSKDVVRMWETEWFVERDWLTPQEWAIDRIYQENLHFCSPECIEADTIAEHIRELNIARQRLLRKYR